MKVIDEKVSGWMCTGISQEAASKIQQDSGSLAQERSKDERHRGVTQMGMVISDGEGVFYCSKFCLGYLVRQ